MKSLETTTRAFFLSGILLRGIPDDSFYIFCHGLRSMYNVTPKYETVISCAELLSAIKSNITHCGLCPQLNGYIYAMLQGIEQRTGKVPSGRNTSDLTKQTISVYATNSKFKLPHLSPCLRYFTIGVKLHCKGNTEKKPAGCYAVFVLLSASANKKFTLGITARNPLFMQGPYSLNS
ncbi:hypothetical protein DAPPUDRAFT_254669 [Daphnia pulex]|uniref:Uncharacterized protein n=1 Tax=Daphnia pulex TaxID=6669 RepID=E9H7L0_DAPPU|nr:hypothetical protein DAPPUDRAFT_254669 [Daphnia pulex]|eukprot:EFX72205.1 hypothetical protein DAPPUDRAFT_254669 [Daphnia pulex]